MEENKKRIAVDTSHIHFPQEQWQHHEKLYLDVLAMALHCEYISVIF